MVKHKMDISEIADRIRFHEGCVLFPYICPAGKMTIGIGHNVDDNPFTADELRVIGEDWKHGITKQSAYYLCNNDIKRCIEELKKKLPMYDNLDCERQYALIDLDFNMGWYRLSKFKKMLEALGAGNYKRAAEELLNSKYATQVGKRAQRIAKLIETGRWEQWIG